MLSKSLFLVVVVVFALLQLAEGKDDKTCKKPCKKGYECDDGVCKMLCGGESMNPVECPAGYHCYGEQMAWDAPGHCEKIECGGIADIKCKGGYWCDIVQKDITDPMGVCTNRLCPSDCAVWFDGCNTCQCSEEGPICTKIACSVMETPYCKEKVDPPTECDIAKKKLNEIQEGIVADMLSLFNRLDENYKKAFMESIESKN